MLKRKTITLFLAAISLFVTAVGLQNVTVQAAEALAVEKVEGEACFTVTDGVLYGVEVPSDITSYFEVVIPDGVTEIALGAFDGTEDGMLSAYMIAIDIPSSVTTVQADAFDGCRSLLEVRIANQALYTGLTQEDDTGLLSNAKSVVKDAGDKSLKWVSDSLGSYLFVRNGASDSTEYTLVGYNGSETEITLPAPAIYTGCTAYAVYDYAFYGTAITSLTVPAGVTALGANSFNNCASLKSVTLNEGLKTIGDYAFTQSAITNITIPASVTEIGEHAFNGCTSLIDVTFEERTQALTVAMFSFNNCTGLRTLKLPSNTTIRQFAFDGCTSLLWVYVGENTSFKNTAKDDYPDAVFFPKNTSVTIIFPSASAYNAMLNQSEETFKNNNAAAATYVVKVNCYIGASETPVVYERLYGKSFNYVMDETGYWNTDTAYSALPAQAANYSATTWYSDRALENKVSYDGVNGLLSTESEINLYCYETVEIPSFPAEPASWVYKASISYDINELSEVLKALGCEKEFTVAQLSAMQFSVVFTDEKGEVADTPDAISTNGVYSVTLSLKPEYGSWSQTVTSTVTINVNTSGFNAVLIVFIVLGVLLVAVTVSTAIIRKKVQARRKKKRLSQKEVLEKFRATGEETHLLS